MKKFFLKRVSCFTLAAVLSVGLLSSIHPAAAVSETQPTSFADQFQKPEAWSKPYARWWICPGVMTEEETRREIRSMAQAGFGGLELVGMNLTSVKFGGDEWNQTMKWALDEAIKNDIKLDFTLSQMWPLSVPSITDVNDTRNEQALFCKEVEFSATTEQMTYQEKDGLPIPEGNFDLKKERELIAVTASQKQDDGVYDSETVIDLMNDPSATINQNAGVVKWTAPHEGDWSVFYLYRQSTGSMAKAGGTYVIDHTSKEATQALIDCWENGFQKDPELQALYEKNGGSIFADSLELGNQRMPESAMWTDDFLQEFENRRGYDLTPYLPVIFIDNFYQHYAHRNSMDSEPRFNFAEIGYQIRMDFFQTLTELYEEDHLAPLSEWAHSHNMTLRYQIYGGPFETTSSALVPDINETETLFSNDSRDVYRLQSGVVHMKNKQVYSSESAAIGGLAWRQTWTGSYTQGVDGYPGGNASSGRTALDKGLFTYLNRQFVTGVNRVVLHGFSYRSDKTNSWPGDSGMSDLAGYSNEWDDKTPLWQHVNSMTDYLSRIQFVLQQGQGDIDLALYRYNYYDSSSLMESSLNALESNGYTYDFVSPAVLNLENAVVSKQNGQAVLAANGPSYKALVIDQRLNAAKKLQQTCDMPVETAQRILEYAQAGLPVILLGEAPTSVGSYQGSADQLNQANRQLTDIMQQLVAYENVISIDQPSREKLVSVLEQMNVVPDASPDRPATNLFYHRNDTDAEYYYIYNDSLENSCTQTVTLKGEGIPYQLDPWSGEVSPIAKYEEKDGAICLEVSLQPNDNLLIAIAKEGWYNAVPKSHIVHADVPVSYNQDGSLVAKTMEKGEYHFTDNNGNTLSIQVDAAEPPVNLNQWTMQIESWTPGDTPLETHKQILGPYELETLIPWNEIDGLEDVAGVASYNTSFELQNGWEQGQGAFLSFTRVSDTMKLEVNGTVVPINQLSKQADIGPYLKQGKNELTVEVASSLSNIKTNYTQEFGVIGDVSVIPYRQTELTIAPVADKTILSAVIAYAQIQYDSESFQMVIEQVQKSFTAALGNARSVYNDSNAEQACVDVAWKSLMTEIHKLGFIRGDKTALGKLLEVAQEFNDQIDLYTAGTANPFLTVFAAAKETYRDGNAMQNDVESAAQFLLDAMMDLRLKPDKSILAKLLTEADSIDQSAYSSESIASFLTAYRAAKTVYHDANAQQDKVDEAVDALQEAIEGLNPVDTAQGMRPLVVRGDKSTTVSKENAKTGESGPLAVTVALLILAGTGLMFNRKKR